MIGFTALSTLAATLLLNCPSPALAIPTPDVHSSSQAARQLPSVGHAPTRSLLSVVEERAENMRRQSAGLYPQYGYDVTKCGGYQLSGLMQTSNGLMANLTQMGSDCNAFGKDIRDLTLLVEYQSQERLHVHIYDTTEQQWQIPESLFPRPGSQDGVQQGQTDLEFHHNPNPFEFWITRRSSGDVLFDTRSSNIPTYSDRIYQNGGYVNGTAMPAHPLVFEDQYLQISSALPSGANIYGNGEIIASSGIRRNSSNSLTTLWAADVGDPIDGNLYGTHAYYFDKRSSGTHGVFMLNSHGMNILQRDGVIEWRLIGGTIDLYLVSGPTEIKAIEQYADIVGLPQQTPDWAFGYHQCRWGYHSLNETRDAYNGMVDKGIPLETQWNDIDWMKAYRNFELDINYPASEYADFLSEVHSTHRHYIPIIDAAFAVPTNDSDVYDPYTRGKELNIWLMDETGKEEYWGRVWPGVTVFVDYLANQGDEYTYETLANFSKIVDFDGLWLDMNEPSSFVIGSDHNMTTLMNTSTPFSLPETPGNNITTYGFPECFDKTLDPTYSGNITVNGRATCDNATQLATVAMTNDFDKFTMYKRDSNGINYIQPPLVDIPPYDIHNDAENGGQNLDGHTVAANATCVSDSLQPGLQLYHWKNLYGTLQAKSYNAALQRLKPGVRPFIVARSTFAGAGKYASHWLGDNTSTWTYLFRSIQGVLQFQWFQIPMVGPDTGGFNGNTDEELYARWLQLSAFFPFMRTHTTKGSLHQAPYFWDSTTTIAKNVLKARYSLLPMWESLQWDASRYGTPMVRPLFFAFDSPQYYDNSGQFMIGDFLLVTPVLEPNATSVVGALPTMGNTQWRNFFTHELVQQTSDIVRLDAPLLEINAHIRSGAVLLLHRDPAQTIYDTKQGPYSLLVNLDSTGYATGCVKIDDGMSLPSNSSATRMLTWTAQDNSLSATVDGDYQVSQQLAEIVILGVAQQPKSFSVNGQQATNVTYDAKLEKVVVSGISVDLNSQPSMSWAF